MPDDRYIIFFLEGRNVPASRFRVEQYAPCLKESGYRFSFLYTVPSKYLWCPRTPLLRFLKWPAVLFSLIFIILTRFFQIALYVPRADIVVFQRDLLFRVNIPFLEGIIFSLCWLKRSLGREVRIVFDVDDLIFASPRTSLDEKISLSWKMRYLSSRVDAIIAGNRYLASFFPQEKVTIVPTVLPWALFAPYAADRPEATHPKVIGWSGLAANLPYLRELFPVFDALSREFQFTVHILCERGTPNPFPQASFGVEMIPWTRDNEIAELRKFDIGIMPLPDTPWTRGKCGFKALQYMFMGVPTVASAVGTNCEIIKNSVTGFLAANHNDWLRVFRTLLSEKEFAEAIGKAGQTSVREQYSREAWFPTWLQVVVGVGRTS